MPDIFGRDAEDYTFWSVLFKKQRTWDAYQAGQSQIRDAATVNPQHDFSAFGGGVPEQYQRASQDQQAIGYLTNNMLAIQTMVDEVMYTAYRLPNYIHLNTSIPEGARSYGVRVRDRVGQATRISGPGFEAPSATASEAIITQPIFWYGLGCRMVDRRASRRNDGWRSSG